MAAIGQTILFVLLTLIKILGILILAVLLLLLLVLFAAVKYRLCVSLEERTITGSVTWLGFVLRIPFRIEDGDVTWRLRLLGIPIMSSNRRKKPAGERKEKKPRKKSRTKPAESGTQGKEQGETVSIQSEGAAKLQEGGQSANPVSDGQSGEEPEKKPSILRRIKEILRKLYAKLRDGKEQLTAWLRTMREVYRTLRKKAHSLRELIDILRSDHGKAFICIAKENMIHLLRQLRPRSVKGEIHFGTGDPCSTGEVLGILAVVYAWTGITVKVTPDFMEKCLEGQVRMRGRIRIVTLIRIALRIIWNKEGKRLQREFQKWKEDF